MLDEAFEADAWAPGELETDPRPQDIFAKLRIVQPENTGRIGRLPANTSGGRRGGTLNSSRGLSLKCPIF